MTEPDPPDDNQRERTTDRASGNHDDFEAEKRLSDAVAELAAAGYAIPDPGDTDRAVMRWMEAIPPGKGEDLIHFLRQINALLSLALPGGRSPGEARPETARR